ncbi:macro domain-containing protein [Bifidobacterium callitrichos]|uniref:Putative phosphatase homologous to the C-terminal domain of histone macroH2A1 n=1 Tax=Bifidobacterium callitrichos DSM 23973 TaxID=1437609 RepID=A0A086ZXQ6_9BIFI|nr:macro domain-containing protein [Bifidobacterium callitrichos]KFI51306.1 putative phosphatase homologous to the C-terminal domain of histone macroH2A1 [Bifidobacterium callitrichos DSM 23973]
MPLRLVRQDITRLDVDAVVNAANTALRMGGGVCGAIFRAAGASRMQEACDRLSPIRTGQAVATAGFDLPARYVIHTAGPVWQGGDHGEETLLRACYRNSLTLAVRLKCGSIAFPLISSGIYGYPKAQALDVAVDEIRRFLDSSEETPKRDDPDHGDDPADRADLDVYLCVFDKEAFAAGTAFDRQLRAYIDDHYVAGHTDSRRSRMMEMRELGHPSENIVNDDESELRLESPTPLTQSVTSLSPTPRSAAPVSAPHYSQRDVLADLDEPFNVILLRLIDSKGFSDVDVYKRANISRKLFSKIRCGNGYMPGKKTVLALAIALRLDLDETDDLLACAGYALSHSVKFDVIVEFFITHGVFDVLTINEVLFRYDQPLLGQ